MIWQLQEQFREPHVINFYFYPSEMFSGEAGGFGSRLRIPVALGP